MIKTEAKSEFFVCIITHHLDFSTRLRTCLVGEGYKAYTLADEDLLFSRLATDPPHVVVLTVEALGQPIEKFVQTMHAKNPEVQLVVVGASSELLRIKDYFGLNVIQALPVATGQFLSVEILAQAVQVACRRLFDIFQNEQIYLDLQKEKVHSQSLQKSISELASARKMVLEFHVAEELKTLQSAESRDELFQRFFERARDMVSHRLSGLYFRFFPAQSALIPVSSVGVDIDRLKGLGVPLEGNVDPLLPKHLTHFLSDVLKVRSSWTFPIQVFGQPDGVVVIWSDQNISFPLIENLAAVLQTVLERKAALRLRAQQDDREPGSGFLRSDRLPEILNNELARASRLQLPVSFIFARFDHFDTKKWSQSERQIFLKKVWDFIAKTTRVYDQLFYFSEVEFGILLPHTPSSGAALRAERLRHILETKSLALWGEHLTLSLGVADHLPVGKTRSGQNLEKLSLKALEKARSLGGNRVQIFEESIVLESTRPAEI